MLRISLFLALVGVFTLLILLLRPASWVESIDQIENKKIVLIRGSISDVRIYSEQTYFKINGVPARCSCSISSSQNALVRGYVDSFNNERFVRVLSFTPFTGT